MQLKELYDKAAAFRFLTIEEGVHLYHHAPLTDLMFLADELRKKQVPHGKVTWQIGPECKHHQCLHRQLQVLQFLPHTRPCRSIYNRHAYLPEKD